MNRIRAGYCLVPNPFNTKQISRVSLAREDVDAIVFWTKNPRPFLGALDELDRGGFRYFFQFTLNAYARALEPRVPPFEQRIATFRELASRLEAKGWKIERSPSVGPELRCLSPSGAEWRSSPVRRTSLRLGFVRALVLMAS